ncbi:TetR/AcrR family transcriptional regulator [Pseudonocardia thermophila]|mgnify:CR=1 FL=1|uniref:TetR/AcrR family transcriptional regulator n=1 Tax=Pseudonocardia thermophila TaxID=1848 RepID=UPI00248D94F4|nr:TetR/AcrR family transcriptional regulator [Pseudonocardia thermophila]
MAGKRAEARRRNAEALTDAAERLFTEHGYHAVGIEAIAEAAGLTTGAIYSIFGSKRALLRAVLDRRIAQLDEMADPIRLDEHACTEDAVAAYARAYADLGAALGDRRALRLEIDALALHLAEDTPDDPLIEVNDLPRRQLARLLEGRTVAATGQRLSAGAAAELALIERALVTGLAQHCALTGAAPDPDLWVRAAAALVGAVVGQPAPAEG